MSAEDVDGVIGQMREIADRMDERDGVARFNLMYLAVTEAVRDRLAAHAFLDEVFLSRLTVVFAALYLEAYREDEAGRAVPRAWAPLFAQRRRPRVTSVQFALAGMNAHINYDLGLAVVATCREIGVRPRAGTPQHADYLTMNAVLAEVSERVKDELCSALVGLADGALGRLDDVLAMWSIARARDAAWVNAETIAAIERIPLLRDHYLHTLGGTVGLAGRGLLIPVL